MTAQFNVSTHLLTRCATLVIALLITCVSPGALHANQLDPAKLDSMGQRVVKVVVEQAATKTTVAEKLGAYERAITAHLLPNKFAIVCGLLFEAQEMARKEANRREALDAYWAMVESFDFDEFTPKQRTHIDYLVARWDAFNGFVNQSESALLEILAKDSTELSLYTATSAHYIAAYCSYYTNHLERCALHARKSARGFYEMGDMLGALEGYDGTSTTYFKMGKVDSALFYARKGLALVPLVKEHEPFNLYLNYAEALMGNQQRDSAFHYAQLAYDMSKELARYPAEARAELCLANLYNTDRASRQAINYYEKAAASFTKSNEPYHLVDVLDSLSALYADVGNYQFAYQHGMQGFALRDSLREDRVKSDNDRLVAEAERDALSLELRKSEDERALAQAVVAKRQTERLAWGALCVILVMMGGFLYFRTKTRKRLNQKLRQQVEERTADLRAHSDQLERQAAKLKESNAELERFAYIASHDLKTPLRNVTSFLGLIERRLPAESRALVSEYLDIALDNARQMHDLVTDVLEFSRLNSNINELVEPISVCQVVTDVKQHMKAELDERRAVVECVGDQELVLPKGTLEQILGNLIGNAIKYNEAPHPEAKVVVVDMGERVRISVSDNGIGISPEYHDRIFEVFRRLHTSDEYTGTGVGLAASRKVALRLGGDIRVESTAGIGSTFTVDLPKDARVELDNPQQQESAALAAS